MLFSQDIPSNNLGFVDPKADVLEVEIAGNDYTLHQSPGLLNSRRQEGTTGAVLWKITPLLATWLASKPSILARILHEEAVVVELGCGIAGLIGLVLSQFVQLYILTDQDYVMKNLTANLAANATTIIPRPKKGMKPTKAVGNIGPQTMSLDWEKDSAQNLGAVIPKGSLIDLVLLCDCVYNEHLVPALVQTCTDICRLGSTEEKTTVVLIAQQLRSDTVFELFLDSLMRDFDVWRVPDEKISADLRPGSGYAVHLATLKHAGVDAE